ncbi:MAG: twin-arginine translocation signal domain-containing protein [Anaerolineae bacterium]|nr:twin-arginine translocation signal domain-containing protein [Anaerolineae bacterium]
MKQKISRRDFLKLAGAGAAVSAALGYAILRESDGDPIIERNPYSVGGHTAKLDGSVPILILTSRRSPNRFGAYLDEILRAEGLNCFHTADVSSLGLESIRQYDIVLLAEMPLNKTQIETFEAYVAQGGRLVCMRPVKGLESAIGVEKFESTLSNGYLKTEESHPTSAGINQSTMQFHGLADLYKIVGAKAVAWLYTDRVTPSANPAITMNRFGEGLAVAFSFDLAQSVALMRQGNPELANQDLDGLDGPRTIDMFLGWIDLERIHLPQADEQQRLLVNLLNFLSKRPLPRIWYFPNDTKSVLVATGDSHSNPAPFIEEVLSRVDQRNGHMTIYYSPQIVNDVGRAARWTRFWLTDHVPPISNLLGEEFGSPTPLMVEGWRARGHEITLHPYVESGLGEWEIYWKEFTGRGYGPISLTVRTHRVLWTGWTETARVQATYGMRMNLDYYHVGPSLQKTNGEWVYGHLTGSGRPMKFIDESGRLLDIYQQLTQLADEHLIPMDVPGWGGWPQLSAEEAVEVSKYLFDRSVKHGDYCAIGGQFHVDPFQLGGDPAEKGRIFLEGTLDYANDIGVPIVSAKEWLDFTDIRHEIGINNVLWDSSVSSLTFHLNLPLVNDSVPSMMIPVRHNEKTLSVVSVDGVTKSVNNRLVLGGMEYTLVGLTAQEHTIKALYN